MRVYGGSPESIAVAMTAAVGVSGSVCVRRSGLEGHGPALLPAAKMGLPPFALCSALGFVIGEEGLVCRLG